MRLIDADALKTREVLDKLRSAEFDDEIEAVIDNIPTAYTVKNVVAAIKTKHCKVCRNIWKSKDGAEYCREIDCEIEGVCEIVRNGGKE